MWLIVAFATIGFLVGNLMGMSASSTVPSFLGLLFALLGGSLIAFLHKLTAEDRVIAGKLVFALSLMCLLGVVTGVSVNERELLTPKERRFLPLPPRIVANAVACNEVKPGEAKPAEASDVLRNKYLAAGPLSEIDQINEMKRLHRLSPEEAYDKLLLLSRQRCGAGGTQ